MAFLGGEEIVGDGIVDHARHHLAFALQPDGDGEMRNAMHEIGGAVDRIDDEAVGLVGAFDRAAFLAQKAIAGPRLGQFLDQDLFGALVGAGDEIGRTLHRDLEIFQFAEIADQRAAGLARGGDHHIQGGREIGHHYSARRT